MDDEKRPNLDVKKFIDKQSKLKSPSHGYDMTHSWLFHINQLRKGKPVTYNDKLINPKILDLSKYRKGENEQK